ncbi:tol-pal system protein YbgF [Halochromatium salexigens]|nr:tol-pal system protein YbgF [Halochromatium salexigens]
MRQSRPFLASMALALVLMILTTALNPALAVEPAVEARLSRLERMLNERSLSELLLQLQQLQQEVQELRGQVETQQYLLRREGIGGASFESQFEPQFEPQPEPQPESRAPASSRFGADERDSSRLPSPSSLSFDPAADGGPNEPAFVLPGQAALTSERERVRPVDPGLLGLPAPETSSGGEREQYREAFERLKARDYAAARSAFSDMVERYPQGQFADNGRYWLGEIGYVTQDYPAAQRAFSQLITDYPQSPKVPAAMLKLGYVSYEQDEFDAARRVLEEVVRRFPQTTEARLAQGRLDRMQREQP